MAPLTCLPVADPAGHREHRQGEQGACKRRRGQPTRAPGRRRPPGRYGQPRTAARRVQQAPSLLDWDVVARTHGVRSALAPRPAERSPRALHSDRESPGNASGSRSQRAGTRQPHCVASRLFCPRASLVGFCAYHWGDDSSQCACSASIALPRLRPGPRAHHPRRRPRLPPSPERQFCHNNQGASQACIRVTRYATGSVSWQQREREGQRAKQ